MQLGDLRDVISEVAGDAYRVLGVPTSASADDIKLAYRKKSIELHPDKNQGKDTTKEMTKVNVAYSILSDPKKRAQYNMVGDKTIDTMDDSKWTGQGALGAGGSTYGYGYGQGSSDDSWKQDFINRVRREAERRDAERARAERERRAAKQAQADREAAQQRSASRTQQPASPGDERERKRYYTYNNDAENSHKFWWIKPNIKENTITVGWGRIGTSGQVQTKPAVYDNAYLDAVSQIRIKLRKGYVEQGVPGQRAPMPSKPTSTPTQKPKPSGPKTTYKIYGRKGTAPLHTRFKGKVYGAASGTKFKQNDQVNVSPVSDGKLSVSDPKTGHTQAWDTVPEAFCSLVGDLIIEAMSSDVIG